MSDGYTISVCVDDVRVALDLDLTWSSALRMARSRKGGFTGACVVQPFARDALPSISADTAGFYQGRKNKFRR